MQSEVIESLVKSMQQLPGIGNKSARRLALHVIRNKNTVMHSLLQSLNNAHERIVSCVICANISEHSPCHICSDQCREREKLCIVKDVSDLWVLENSKVYRGLYHVLGGNLSAMSKNGPENLNIDSLKARLANGIEEVIIATDATLSGQTTAHYIAAVLKQYTIKISRLAFGIPVGGELDYLDEGTLAIAMQQRSIFSSI